MQLRTLRWGALPALLLPTLLLTHCSDDGGGGGDSADAGVVDTDSGEPADDNDTGAGEEDTGPEPGEDAGNPPVGTQGLCDGCRSNADCEEEGSICIQQDPDRLGFCGRGCEPTDPEACPTGYFCLEHQALRSPQCIPINFSFDCGTNSLGLPCTTRTEEEVCKHSVDSCVRLGRVRFCTLRCEGNDDCPPFFNTCAEAADGNRYCVPGAVERADGCGGFEGPEPLGRPCRVGCESDQICSTDILEEPPPPTNAFCTYECTEDDDCGLGATCDEVDDGRGRICLTEQCDCLADLEIPEDTVDLLGEALAEARLDRCSAGFPWETLLESFNSSIWFEGFRSNQAEAQHDRPLTIPAWARATIEGLDRAAAGEAVLADLVREAAGHSGVHLAPAEALELPVGGDGEDVLVAALSRLLILHGEEPDASGLARELEGVPASHRPVLALLVSAVSKAAEARAEAFANLFDNDGSADAIDFLERLYDWLPSADRALVTSQGEVMPVLGGLEAVYRGIFWDRPQIYGAAADLLASVQVALDAWPDVPAGEGFFVDIDTPIGRIIFADDTSATHGGGSLRADARIALFVDTGGDDTYQVPVGATVDWDHGVSLHLDIAGSDRYGYEEVPDEFGGDEGRLPSDRYGRAAADREVDGDKIWGSFPPRSLSDRSRQGAARMGIGIVVDAGDEGDEYHSLRTSQGFGALGVGMVADLGGDDAYEAEAGSQAAAVGGLGILYDREGADSYHAWTRSQAWSHVSGTAVLFDADGDDRYLANPGDTQAEGGDSLYNYLDEPEEEGGEPIDLGIAISMSQGAGAGDFYAAVDGRRTSLAGGLAILRDRAGDDIYRADARAQGFGDWFGRGLLADGSGDDSFDAVQEAQGVGESWGLGTLIDDGGDDQYNPDVRVQERLLGSGFDRGVGVVLEAGGDDLYEGAEASLGFGDVNGFGLFIDVAGDDFYDASDTQRALGVAREPDVDPPNPRLEQDTVGLFIDGGGTDRYERRALQAAGIGNNRSWRYETDLPHERAGGIDGEGDIILAGVIDEVVPEEIAEGEGEGEGEGEEDGEGEE